MIKYNEFQSACKLSWDTEGSQEHNVYNILRFLGTYFGMTRSNRMIAEAWKIYKSTPDDVNKYVLNTKRGTQCSVRASNTMEAWKYAERVGWSPRPELPMFIQKIQ